jgi:hypothetical protein
MRTGAVSAALVDAYRPRNLSHATCDELFDAENP